MESKWFVDENVKNIDKEILLCFPYAGASINMFSMWKEYIDKVIACPVKLPFRDARRKEKLPESVQKLAEVFVKENIDIMRKRYSIFGHCTGAILGYEIARQTYEKTGNEPTVIIASSSQEPAIIPKEAILLAGASDSEIQAYLETERLVDKSILEMIPIVYTSTLGVSDSDNSFLSRSNISYKISQTPQVWIDCQIAEENGGVAVNWDYRTGVFLQNVIRDMFEAFERVLKRLGKKDNTVLKETDPIGLPEKTQAVRNKVNATERELPESLMAEGFVKSCVLYPNKTALITKDGEYTYAALKQYVSAVQHTLLENGLKPGDSAAVMLPKGIWQIAGVLGTLLAGGVYLPIDSKQPLQRRNDIIQDSGVKFVLTEKVEELYNQEKLTTINVNILDATTEYQLREIAGVRGSDPAYIIYTSGTTGKPKGVVISHEAAMNTILY